MVLKLEVRLRQFSWNERSRGLLSKNMNESRLQMFEDSKFKIDQTAILSMRFCGTIYKFKLKVNQE